MEYEIEPVLPPIPPERLLGLEWDLDLTDWEMNRTHWALKDIDLFPVLLEVGLIDPVIVHAQPAQSRIQTIGLAQKPPEVEARPTVFRMPNAPRENDLVSVMVPFANGLDAVYTAIEWSCAQVGMRCQRADNICEEDEIIQDIFSPIFRSAIVVCDFSGQNPNVFYEAIAHTLGRPVIPTTQNAGDVPFDLRHRRYIPYLLNDEGRRGLAEQLIPRLNTLRNRLL